MLVYFLTFFSKLFIVQQFNPVCDKTDKPNWNAGYQMSLPKIAHYDKQKLLTYFSSNTREKETSHQVICEIRHVCVCVCVCAEGTSGLCNRQFFDNQFVLLILVLASSCTQLLLLCRDQFRRSGIDSRHARGHFQTCGSHYLVSLYSMICKF